MARASARATGASTALALPTPGPASLRSMSTTPQPRPKVLAIPAYVAGKPPTPRPGHAPCKLSSNENPYPPLRGVLEAASEAAAQMNRYPDMGSTALYAALAETLGVPTEDLAAATGSVARDRHPLRQARRRLSRRSRHTRHHPLARDLGDTP